MTLPKGWKPSTNSFYTSNKSRIDFSNNKNSDKNREIKKALIIGVSQYDNLPQLDLCKNDAEEMYKVLQSQEYEIGKDQKLVGYVTFHDLWDKIHLFFQDSSVKSKDTLFFYFSGHGVPDGRYNYLASSETEENYPSRRGFDFDRLTYLTENCNSRRIIAILDCCFSGSIRAEGIKSGTSGRIGDDDTTIAKKARETMENRIKESEGLCFLASSLSYQQSLIKKNLGHSLYTYYLLEGLKGRRGYIDDNGYVTADHLSRYVYDKLIDESKDLQKPIKKSNISGELIIAHYPNLVKRIEEQPRKPSTYPAKSVIPITYPDYILKSSRDYGDIIDQFKLQDRQWEALNQSIKQKRCLPFIGSDVFFSPSGEFPLYKIANSLLNGLKDKDKNQIKKYLDITKNSFYPLDISDFLVRIAEYISNKSDDDKSDDDKSDDDKSDDDKSDDDKSDDELAPHRKISSRINQINVPDFHLDVYRNNPYLFLGNLHLPIYITTNYDHFMEEALEAQGKRVSSIFCPWNEELIDYIQKLELNSIFETEYRPTPSFPIVYHLFGDIKYPKSMVLTQKDYDKFRDFLNREDENTIFPSVIRIQLAISSLLFIGYNVNQLNFRYAFDGMIRRFDFIMSPKRMIVQPFPPLNKDDERDDIITQMKDLQEIAKKKYEILTYWGNIFDFQHDLMKEMK